jgi:hypothetical protein
MLYGFSFYGGYGAYDPQVGMAQDLLNKLRITDYENKPLVVDGIWGNRVNSAFAKFYAAIGKPQPSSLTIAVLKELQAAAEKAKVAEPFPGGAPPSSQPPSSQPPPSDNSTMIAVGLGIAALLLMAWDSKSKAN